MREKIEYINTCKDTSDKISLLLRDRRIVKVLESLYDKKFVHNSFSFRLINKFELYSLVETRLPWLTTLLYVSLEVDPHYLD